MSVARALEFIQTDRQYKNLVAHIEILPPRDAVHGKLDRSLPADLLDYLNSRHIQLYSHQTRTIEFIREGRDVIITTGTASGKTLAFNLPIFERFISDKEATALYLYPTKALANDQLKSLKDIEHYTGIDTAAAIYDGDTPQGHRPSIRSNSRLIITNPYELHQILPWHYKWARFLKNLDFLVIDEAHRYRGVFGSHIAFLLKRLQRLCRFYGSSPQLILSSATLANPEEFAKNLTGKECSLIAHDGSPRGKKYFILYNPHYDGNPERSAHREAKELFLLCIKNDLQTLCFTTSRKMSELIFQWSKQALEQTDIKMVEKISPYRAGYLPDERRYIENQLKDGSIQGVVSTNALELGIDIGSLDAVILAGFPGTLISTWQQAGRAGRRSAESIAILVGFQNPLDQYFMHHPEAFFRRSTEHAIVDDKNPYILSGHLLCAASELPIEVSRDAQYFDGDIGSILQSLEKCQLLRQAPIGWVYSGRGRAVDAVTLDSISNETYRIVCNGGLLETMDRTQAYREAHPGAILLHGGETYLVKEFDLEHHVVRVEITDVDYYTEAIKTADLTIKGEIKQRFLSDIPLSLGDVEVSEQYIGYRIIHRNATIGYEPLNLPLLHFTTKAIWFTVPQRITDTVERLGGDIAGGLHGVEHTLIGVMPFHVMCDRWDIGGLSTTHHSSTAPTVFIYDAYEGGIGLTEKAYDLIDKIITTGHELVQDCSCEKGCPGCIYSPKCGNDNQPLDKRTTQIILSELHKATRVK